MRVRSRSLGRLTQVAPHPSPPAVSDSWSYDWQSSPDGPANDAEFDPMAWGARDINPTKLATARSSCSTLLGFNQPDVPTRAGTSGRQASVAETAGRRDARQQPCRRVPTWTHQATGRTSSRPVASRRLRVDFIALHRYGITSRSAAVDELRTCQGCPASSVTPGSRCRMTPDGHVLLVSNRQRNRRRLPWRELRLLLHGLAFRGSGETALTLVGRASGAPGTKCGSFCPLSQTFNF
ncbi:glycosyl hydrolase [Amycolatopsis pretoriensis]